MARPSVLYIDFEYQYINPTPSLFPLALSRYCTVHHYGPGYSGAAVLNGGIDRFAGSVGHIDFVVVPHRLAADYQAERLHKALSQFARFTYTLGTTSKALADIRRFLVRHKNIVIVSLLDTDIYAIAQSTLDSFMNHGTYFIAPREDCFHLDSADLDNEKFIHKKRDTHRFGLYHEFSRAIKSRRITLSHIVAESEFGSNTLSLRPHDVSVPGSRYFRRQVTYERLKRRRDLSLAKRSYEHVFRLADKAGLKPFANIYMMTWYQAAFRQLLRTSKVCVTDGGLIDFTIRKFLEIPAAGAVLVCWPTVDFAEIGFQDKVNCLSVGSSDDVIQCVRDVAKAPESFQRIADAGRELVMDRHSLGARSIQLRESLSRILNGTFQGSYWNGGNFCFAGEEVVPLVRGAR